MADPELRELSLDDAGWVADLLTECHPDDPHDPVLLRHRWATQRPDWYGLRGGVIAEGRPVGFCAVWHAPWVVQPDRTGEWELSLVAGARGLAAGVIGRLEDTLSREGALALSTTAYEDDRWLTPVLEAAGYARVSALRQSELDLAAHRERLLGLASEARAGVARRGLRLVTLAEVGSSPGIWSRLTDLMATTGHDAPSDEPFQPQSEGEVRAELEGPDIGPARVWLVMDGETVAGISYLSFPPVRGLPTTAYTASARSHRGLGVARAAKLATLEQAIAMGAGRVRTDNDERNAPMLGINRALGYQPIPGWVIYRRSMPAPA